MRRQPEMTHARLVDQPIDEVAALVAYAAVGNGDNWDPNGAPSPGNTVDLTFGGTTRLTPNNNYTAFDDFRNLDFAAGAGSFTLSGNAIDLFGRVENQSTNLQTVSIALAINAIVA